MSEENLAASEKELSDAVDQALSETTVWIIFIKLEEERIAFRAE